MAQQDTPTADQKKTANTATQPGALDLGTLALIAVTGAPGARRALVRHRNGRIETLRPGDKLGGGAVTEITADSLHYERRGKRLALSMPG